MNAASSRSHCIVTVSVEKTCPDGSTVSGKLRMVDLAGRWVVCGGTGWRAHAVTWPFSSEASQKLIGAIH